MIVRALGLFLLVLLGIVIVNMAAVFLMFVFGSL